MVFHIIGNELLDWVLVLLLVEQNTTSIGQDMSMTELLLISCFCTCKYQTLQHYVIFQVILSHTLLWKQANSL